MQSNATTVEGYLESLPDDRRNVVSEIRDVILKNLPEGYKEAINWGMVAYGIPLDTYPNTYNGQSLCYAAIASQKNHVSVYLNNIYADPNLKEWFKKEYEKTGKKLDMGKACIRFKKLDDLALDLIGEAVSKTSVEKYIQMYEKSRTS